MAKTKILSGIYLEPVEMVPAVYEMCQLTGKNMYSIKQAREKKNNLKYARWNSGSGKMREYKCPFCNSWHLTSQKSIEGQRGKEMRVIYK